MLMRDSRLPIDCATVLLTRLLDGGDLPSTLTLFYYISSGASERFLVSNNWVHTAIADSVREETSATVLNKRACSEIPIFSYAPFTRTPRRQKNDV
jgi:hypothetical protein